MRLSGAQFQVRHALATAPIAFRSWREGVMGRCEAKVRSASVALAGLGKCARATKGLRLGCDSLRLSKRGLGPENQIDAVPGAKSHSAAAVRRASVRSFAHSDTW